MEILIYGLGGLLRLGVFLFLLFLPICFLYVIGKKFKRAHLEIILPSIVVLGFIGLSAYRYSIYSNLCNEIPYVKYFAMPSEKPEGYMFEELRGIAHHGQFDYYGAIESGYFNFVEIKGNTNGKFQRKSPNKELKTPWTPMNESLSKIIIVSGPLEPISNKVNAPIFSHTIQIMEIQSGKTLAEAKELIYGGGFTGLFMRMSGGDQDYDYHSCGYISKIPGPWRPTLTSRTRYKEYKQADIDFILNALIPNNDAAKSL